MKKGIVATLFFITGLLLSGGAASAQIIGESCTGCEQGTCYYDCLLNCLNALDVENYWGDGNCSDDAYYNFNCAEYNYDNGDCFEDDFGDSCNDAALVTPDDSPIQGVIGAPGQGGGDDPMRVASGQQVIAVPGLPRFSEEGGDCDRDFFSFTAPQSGWFEIFTEYTDNATDTFGDIWLANDENCGVSGYELLSDDDGGDDLNFYMIFEAVAGETYTVAVRGFDCDTQGSYLLYFQYSETGPGPGNTCGPEQIFDCAMNCVSETVIYGGEGGGICGDGYCDKGMGGDYDLNCAAFQYDCGDCPPADCGLGAVPVSVGDGPVSGDIAEAGDWNYFTFTASESRTIDIYTTYTEDELDTYGYLFLWDSQGGACGDMIASNDDGEGQGDDLNFRITFELVAGASYMLGVRGFNADDTGTYNLFIGDAVVAVLLSSFQASAYPGSVVVSWTTDAEFVNAGFNVLRADSPDGEYRSINNSLIPARGSATGGARYMFTDAGVQNRKTYYYKLEDIDLFGRATLHGPVGATPGLLPALLR